MNKPLYCFKFKTQPGSYVNLENPTVVKLTDGSHEGYLYDLSKQEIDFRLSINRAYHELEISRAERGFIWTIEEYPT